MAHKRISEIRGMEKYKDYYITPEGLVYSSKYSTDRLLKFNYVREYPIVRLSDGKGNLTAFYVHKLVALAFLPNPSHAQKIRHKNGNIQDNHMMNLEWIIKKKRIKLPQKISKKEPTIDPSCLIVNQNLSDRIRLIHYASIKKGISVPVEDYDFFYKILNESLDEYINRYGLRKIMYQLENQ